MMQHQMLALGVVRTRDVTDGAGEPPAADELGDAIEPVLVEVVNRAVAQELVRHEERGLRVRGRATSVGR